MQQPYDPMKKPHTRFLFGEERFTDLGLLSLRIWFGGTLALFHGVPKLLDFSSFLGSVTRHGFPFPMFSAGFALAAEFVGGLLLAAGLFTRAAGVSVFLTLLGAAFWAHANDPLAKKEFALAFAVAGLAFALMGPGRFSLDAWLQRRNARSPTNS